MVISRRPCLISGKSRLYTLKSIYENIEEFKSKYDPNHGGNNEIVIQIGGQRLIAYARVGLVMFLCM